MERRLTAEGLVEALRASDRELLGTVVSTADVVFAEHAARRFDLLWIDLEHSALSLRDAQALVIAATAGGAYSLIRLQEADTRGIGPILDTGVDGIILPRVEHPDELDAFASALHFPPRGTRGFAPRRSSLSSGVPGADRRPACIVQVESAAAVEIAPALAAHGVCDALVVGTSDLSFDLGKPLAGGDPRLDGAVEAVREAALAAGKGWGVAAGESPARMRELAGVDGGTLIYGSDVRLFAKALDDLVAALRAGAARAAG
jgi:4-hydroxy-2-oxoheptanedioate aldolase